MTSVNNIPTWLENTFDFYYYKMHIDITNVITIKKKITTE